MRLPNSPSRWRFAPLITGVIFTMAALSQTMHAQTTWSGTGTSWSTATWSAGVPNSATAASLTGTGTFNINTAASAASVDLANTTGTLTLNINDGQSLAVTGAITDSGAGTATVQINTTTSANAATALTATSITASSLSLGNPTTSATFFSFGNNITAATQIALGSASGATAGSTTYTQTAGTVTTTNANYGVSIGQGLSVSNPTGNHTYNLSGGTLIAARIGVLNGNGNNISAERYAMNGTLNFNDGTIQSSGNGTVNIQNGYAYGSYNGTGTKDMQFDTSKPLNVVLAASGTHTFNAVGATGDIRVSPSAQITGSGTLAKTGLGTLTFTGGGPVALSNWSGDTTVTEGNIVSNYSVIAGQAATGGTDTLSGAYSAAAKLILNGGGFTLTGRGSASASSATVSLAVSATTVTVTSTTGLVVGQSVTNANLPAGTYIRRILNSTQIELSAMSTSSSNQTSQTLNFGAASFANSQVINDVALSSSATVTVNSGSGSSTTLLSFGNVTGSGALTKQGTGTLSLTGNNTYTGATTVSAGTLTLSGGSAIGDNGAVSISSGAVLNLGASETVGTIAGAGNITLGSFTLTTNASSDTTLSGVISGTGALTKNSSGTLTLSGSNTYTGATTISAGTIQIDHANGVGSGGNITFGGGGLKYGTGITTDLSSRIKNSGSAILVDTNGESVTWGTALGSTNSGGLTKDGGGTLTLSGNNTYTCATTISAGTLQISSTGLLGGGNYSQSIANSGTFLFGSNSNQTLGGVISGTGALTKNGTGTLTLSGANTYTGTTTVSAGTLDFAPDSGTSTLTGAITGSGAITKSGNGTTIFAGGANTISGTLAVNSGTLQIGNSTVTNTSTQRLTAISSVTVASAATLVLNNSQALADGSAPITLAGNLTGDTTGIAVGGFHNRLGALTMNGGTLTTYNGASLGYQAYALRGDVSVVGSSASYISAGGTSGNNGVHLADNAAGVTRIFDVADATSSSAADLIVSARLLNASNAGAATALTKSGAGTLVLSGSNSYTGTTTASAGVLNIQHANALGTTAGSTTVSSGAALQIQGAITVGAEALSLSGTGVSTTGALRNISGNNTYGGNITLADHVLIASDADLLTLSGGISATDQDFTIGGAGNTTLSGIIAVGTGGLTKDGAGTLTLSGNNTYTGATTISAGTLQISSTGLLGGGNYSQSIANSGAFLFGSNSNQTLGGVISGTGALTKNSTGTLTLSGNNTYTGATTISTGTLQISSTGLLGGGNHSQSIANSGTFLFASNSNQTLGGVISGTGALTKNGTGTLTLSGANTYTGTTTVSAGTLDFAPDSGTSTLTGAITGSGAITKSGNGTTIFAGGAAGNTVSGTLAVNSGTLQIGNSTTPNDNTQRLTAISSVTVASAATLVLNNSGALAHGSAPLTLAGNLTGDTTGIAVGGFHNALGALTMNGGTLTTYNGASLTYQAYALKGDVSVGGSSASYISAGGTSGNNGVHLADNAAGVTRIFDVADATSSSAADLIASARLLNSSNAGASTALTKSGTGTLVLSGSNSYTGATTIAAGTLQIGAGGTTGALSISSAITNNATLAFNRSNTLTQGTDFASAITGSGALIQNGSGTLVLSGVNTYSGSTTVSAGNLTISNASALGSTATGTSVANGAALQIQGDIAIGAEALNLTGSGFSNAGALRNISGTNSLSGAITLSAATTIGSDAGTLTLSGGISGIQNLALVGAGNTTLSGGIATSTGTLTKNGSGIATLTAANTYSGSTNINSGTLVAAAANALGSTSGVVVGNGGSLLVTADDAIGSSTNITLASGNTTAGLIFNGNYNGTVGALTLSADSIIDLGTGSVVLHFSEMVMGLYNLAIYNWTGTTLWNGGNGNNTDQFYVDRAVSDNKLNRISFYSGFSSSSFVGTGFQLSGGSFNQQIIPVPEAETYAAATLLILGYAVHSMWLKRKAGRQHPAKPTA